MTTDEKLDLIVEMLVRIGGRFNAQDSLPARYVHDPILGMRELPRYKADIFSGLHDKIAEAIPGYGEENP